MKKLFEFVVVIAADSEESARNKLINMDENEVVDIDLIDIRDPRGNLEDLAHIAT